MVKIGKSDNSLNDNKKKCTWHKKKRRQLNIGANNTRIQDDFSNDIDAADDLNRPKVLKMMATPVYILACYVAALNASNVLDNDDDEYHCTCVEDSKGKCFHRCPASNKFIPSRDCRLHIECNDPIYTCFDIAQQCLEFANIMPEFGEECKDLSEQVIKFSVDLLAQCSNTDEVKILLAERSGLSKLWKGVNYKKDIGENGKNTITHPRLIAALQLNHKEFVSHVYCQQIVRNQWNNGTTWQEYSLFSKVYLYKYIYKTPVSLFLPSYIHYLFLF